MKIGFDFRMGGTQHGGIGRYAFEILIRMLAINSTDEYVIFYHPDLVDAGDLSELKKYPHATLISTRARHYSVAEQLLFWWKLRAQQLDLVHFPNFNYPILYKRPFIVTIHDVVHHKISGHKKSRYLKFLAYKKVIESAARKSRAILTVSEESKADIVRILGVTPDKITVTYEAATLLKVDDRQVQAIKRSYLLDRPYFLFVGTLERKKNIPMLAKSFDLFLSKYKLDMDLVIAGKPDPHYPEVKFQAMDITHRNRLVFTGYVSDSDLAALYQGAFAYVNASMHEGFGLPGVEAMQRGIPMAVSNLAVFNEIYDNAALYFDPQNQEDIAEKLYLLAKDPQFHAQMQEKSLQRSSYFDWDKTAAQTRELYSKVVAAPPVEPVHHDPIRE